MITLSHDRLSIGFGLLTVDAPVRGALPDSDYVVLLRTRRTGDLLDAIEDVRQRRNPASASRGVRKPTTAVNLGWGTCHKGA